MPRQSIVAKDKWPRLPVAQASPSLSTFPSRIAPLKAADQATVANEDLQESELIFIERRKPRRSLFTEAPARPWTTTPLWNVVEPGKLCRRKARPENKVLFFDLQSLRPRLPRGELSKSGRAPARARARPLTTIPPHRKTLPRKALASAQRKLKSDIALERKGKEG